MPSFLRESLDKLPGKGSNLKQNPLKWVYNFEPISLKSLQEVSYLSKLGFTAVSSCFSGLDE